MFCGLYYYWVNIKLPNTALHVTQEYEDKYGSLIRDIPTNKGFFAIKLISVSLSFKISYALSLAALIEYPLAQVSFGILLNGVVIL